MLPLQDFVIYKRLVNKWYPIVLQNHHVDLLAMALTIVLKANEHFVLNGTLIKNGDRSTKLHIETHCRILRETESIKETEVDTPCKQIWMTLQVIHLTENPSDAYLLLLKQISELSRIMPSSAPFIAAIIKALDDKRTAHALKAVKQLVQHEKDLIAQENSQAHIA